MHIDMVTRGRVSAGAEAVGSAFRSASPGYELTPTSDGIDFMAVSPQTGVTISGTITLTPDETGTTVVVRQRIATNGRPEAIDVEALMQAGQSRLTRWLGDVAAAITAGPGSPDVRHVPFSARPEPAVDAAEAAAAVAAPTRAVARPRATTTRRAIARERWVQSL